MTRLPEGGAGEGRARVARRGWANLRGTSLRWQARSSPDRHRAAVRAGVWALAVLAACTASDPAGPAAGGLPGPVDVTLQAGEERVVEGTALRVSFVGVVEDSRCPTHVVCVWEGNAAVDVGVAVGTGPTALLRVNTAVEPLSAEWAGVRVRVVALEPLPSPTGPPAPEAYRITLRLEPV